MLPFKSLIRIHRNSTTPVYKQVANSIVRLIQEGRLTPGCDLPSSRVMAATLMLHRKTVIAAYEEMLGQDWIRAFPRKGMKVSERLPELRPRLFTKNKIVSPFKTDSFHADISKAKDINKNKAESYQWVINDGFPDSRIAPVDLLFRQYRYLIKKSGSEKELMYSSGKGSLKLRAELSLFLNSTRSLGIGEDHILITKGAQMAIYTAAKMILKKGSKVIVGEPNYIFANDVFKNLGADLIKVPVDEYGIDVDKIEKICQKNKPDLLYIIPHHHHPTTVTLSADRRIKLLAIIRENRLPVIEDDYDYDFHYNRSPILPLASADHQGHVRYIGSLTKSFASSIRLGYLVSTVPIINQAADIKKLIDIHGDFLLEESFAYLFKSGDMQRHLKKSLKLYQTRRDRMCMILERDFKNLITFKIPSGGMSVWAMFDKKYPLGEIASKANRLGLYINENSFKNPDFEKYNSTRIGFASMNDKEMDEVMEVLKKSI
ncbi:MAG: PLP-dependent aminotransferase family protein [Saprospiraceae bacterium]